MARLFVAVELPAAVRDTLAALPRPAAADVRWTPLPNLHVTLRFLGDAAVGEVAGRLDRATLPAATATLGPAVAELRPGLAVVPVAGCDELASAVVAATADVGAAPPDRPFRGHVTLARRRGRGRRLPAGLVGTPVAARFDVTAVALVGSDTRPSGAVHTVLRRWRLH